MPTGVIIDRNDPVNAIETLPAGSTGNRTYLANLLNSTSNTGGRALGGYNLDLWGMQGNIFMDFGSLNVKVGGSYSTNSNIASFGRGTNYIAITAGENAGNAALGVPSYQIPRGLLTTNRDYSIYGKLTHIVDPTMFYSLQFNVYDFFQEVGDQIWQDNFEAYGDPNKNPVLVGPSRNPPAFSVWSFSTAWPGAVPLTYTKIVRSNWGGRVDFTKQFGRTWEFIAGGELTRYTIRSYGIRARNLYSQRLQNPTASDWEIYAPNMVYNQNFGYDIYGQEFEGGNFTDKTGTTVNLSQEGPRHPMFAGAYVQNKFEFSDLVINFGLRYDYIDPGAKEYVNPANIAIGNLNGVKIVADSSYKDQEISSQISPRIGFSFPVTDRTVFHATYGQFLQQGRLGDLYDGRYSAAFFLTGSFARQSPTPNLKPERTTDYEVGFRQQLGEVASFDLSFFYKDIRDLHVIRVIFPEPGAEIVPWFANVNGDFGTSKGVTFAFQMRRTERMAIQGNYTLSSSTATGSASNSSFNIAWQDNSFNNQPYFPVIPTFTDFDRTHVGNINIDYRWAKDDGGPILERLGLNVLFRFSSGIRWTLSQVTGAFNFSTIQCAASL